VEKESNTYLQLFRGGGLFSEVGKKLGTGEMWLESKATFQDKVGVVAKEFLQQKVNKERKTVASKQVKRGRHQSLSRFSRR